MKKSTVSLAVALLAATASLPAEELVRELRWERAPEGATLVAGAPGGGGQALRVQLAAGATVPLLRVEAPPLRQLTWAIVGEVRHEGVAGDGYLEMWSVFPEGRFFSRTLANGGPLGKLSGTSPWRRFVLPFVSKPGVPPPTALEVQLVLPGAGTVEIGTLRLQQYEVGEDPLTLASGAWWSGRWAGLVGGLGGSILGLLGALVGWLGSRGKAPGFVLGLTRALILLGALALVAGGVAVLGSQPWAVWFPLVLLGLVACGALGGAYPGMARRYREAELRRMQSLDAR